MISPAVKDRIRDANDIVATISQYVSLKPTGKTFKGLCPFHQEKTPSFIVHPDKQFYHCFGCGSGGDVFEFIMRMEGISFMEALRELAQRARIVIPEQADPAEEANNRLRQQIYDVLTWAVGRFQKALQNLKFGKPARAYLQQRGITEVMVNRFQLGFAPGGWDHLCQAALREHFSLDLLEKAGLVIPRTENQGVHDRFRERLMFPIADVQGRTVAFGGRVILAGEPKYLNSPETILFRKSELLYGLPLARERTKALDRWVLVEGYLDVIACHAAGVTEAVASLGTALTAHQAQLMKRYAKRVMLIYDADEAGIQAAIRGFEILNQAGLSVRVVPLSGAKDPDELIQKRGAEAFQACLDQAMGIAEFVMRAAINRHGLKTVDGKLAVKQAVLPIIVQLQEAIERQEAARLLAEALRLDERVVMQEVATFGKLARKGNRANLIVQEQDCLPNQTSKASEETWLLSTLLRFPHLLGQVRDQLMADWFREPQNRFLLNELLAASPVDPDQEENWLKMFMSSLTQPGLGELTAKLAAWEGDEEDPQIVVQDCIHRLHARQLAREIDELQMQIKEIQKVGDREAFKSLAQKKQKLTSQLKQLGVIWKPK